MIPRTLKEAFTNPTPLTPQGDRKADAWVFWIAVICIVVACVLYGVTPWLA